MLHDLTLMWESNNREKNGGYQRLGSRGDEEMLVKGYIQLEDEKVMEI